MIDMVTSRDKIRNEIIVLLHILMKKPRAIRGDEYGGGPSSHDDTSDESDA